MMLGLIFTAAAYLLGSLVFFVLNCKRGFSRRESSWVLLAALLGGTIGAKVSRLTLSLVSGVDPLTLLAHPDGRTIIGGIIFGWLAVEISKKRLGITRSTGDSFAFALSAGEAVGRVGCFFNGCCYGTEATVPWAVYQSGAMRHPAQLYSAAAALCIFLFLCFIRQKVKYEGDLFRIYLFLFGSSRFILEFFRERSEVFWGLSIAQWISLEISITMLAAISWTYFASKREKNEQAGVS